MSELLKPPKAWWWHPEIDPATLGQFLDDNKGRLISLKSYIINGKRMFAAFWIKNEGIAWWWNPDVDAPTLGQMLDNNKGRLISLDVYVTGNHARCAGVWVKNNGTAWWWNPNVDPATLGKMLTKNKGRLISLRTYVIDEVRRFAAVWIKNEGTAWWWNPNVDAVTLGQMLQNNQGRLISLDRYVENGSQRFAAVWVKNDDKTWWWNHGVDSDWLGEQFDLFCTYPMDLVAYEKNGKRRIACVRYQYSLKPVNNLNDLQLTGMGTLTTLNGNGGQTNTLQIEIENTSSTSLTLDYLRIAPITSGGYVEYFHSAFEPAGVFASHSKTMTSLQTYNATHNLGSPSDRTHFLIQATSTNGSGKTEYLSRLIPIESAGHSMPTDINVTPPLYLALWTKPVEIVPVWVNDKQVDWIIVAGQIINASGKDIRIAQMGAKLTAGNQTVFEKILPNEFYNWDIATNGWQSLTVKSDQTLVGSGQWAHFLHGFQIDFPDGVVGGQLTVWLNYKIDGQCQTTVFEAVVYRILPKTLLSPVKGIWIWGSTGNHETYNAHTWPAHRHDIDLGIIDKNNKSHGSSSSSPSNSDFYCWDKPVYAMRDGTVIEAVDSNADNNGYTTLSPLPLPNYVLVEHNDGDISGYYHFRQNSVPVTVGQTVEAGDELGRVGNSGGSSEPHLHFGYIVERNTGRATMHPIQFSNLLTEDSSAAVTGHPGNGIYNSVTKMAKTRKLRTLNLKRIIRKRPRPR